MGTPARSFPRLFALGTLLGLLAALPAFAGDLDAGEARTLAALAEHTRRIETNLKLAEEAAGPGTTRPPEAKARLARSRLAEPAGLLPQVQAELAKLPADQADVAALRGRLEAAARRVAALTARLDPATPGGTAPAGAPGGSRLDYKQEKELADATFHLREVEGLAASLEALAQEVEAAGNPDAFDHRKLRAGIAAIEKARQRAGLVGPRLDGLPADGAGVREARERLGAALAAVAEAERRIRPVHVRVESLVDPAAYPDFATDLRRLQDLARQLSDPAQLFSRLRRAAEVVSDAPAAVEEHARFVATYRPLVVQGTPEGEQAAGVSRYFQESHRAFLEVAAATKAGMPQAVDEAVAATLSLAEEAARDGKPAFFLGGIPQRLSHVEDLVALQTALDPDAGAASARRLQGLRADLAARQGRLRDAIIAANVLPLDAYAGPDRDALRDAAKAAWQKVRPDAEILGVRIPARAFEREVMWRRQSREWYLIDRSRLQAIVLVSYGPGLVALQGVNLWRDHLKGDVLTATPVFDPAEEPAPERLLPVDQVR